MSTGAITLKCPHCGGVFLTLQSGGVIEICPHCAVGAPRSNFTVSSDPIGPRPKVDLPPQVKQENIDAEFKGLNESIIESPIPIPEDITLPANPADGPETESRASPAAEPPAARPIISSTPASTLPNQIQPPTETALDYRPVRSRRSRWILFTLLFLFAGLIAFLSLKDPQPVLIPSGSSPGPKVVQDQSPGASPVEVKPAVPNLPLGEVDMLRARAAEEHLSMITDKMIKGLEAATTGSERRRWIDATEGELDDMETFFNSKNGKFEPIQLEPSAGKVTLLPSGKEMKLFRLVTTKCREGALIQVRVEDDQAKMRWALFEQSHEKTFDQFLSAPGKDNMARWFVLLCQRGHTFELKGEIKDRWICLDAQGSLGKNGTGKIYINRDSPAGRFLEPKLQWGQVYLVDMLVSRMEVEGKPMNVVLDCGGLHGEARAE